MRVKVLLTLGDKDGGKEACDGSFLVFWVLDLYI